MPRILMLTTDQAIDRRILLEADALEDDGWEVTILAMPGTAPTDARVVRVAAHGWPDAARREWTILHGYRFARKFIAMNGPWMSRLRSVVWRHLIGPDEFARRLMLPDALRRPADVVVAHDLPILLTAAQAAAHHSAKLVYDSHELYCEQGFEPRLQRMWSDIERRTIGRCDAVITVNPSIARELEQRYGLVGVGVVQNAERVAGPIPPKGRLFHEAFNLEAAARIVLFQGGVLAGRNLETLVDAMACVTAPAVDLVFLGDGAWTRRLARRAAAAGVAHRVHFHPAVPQADLLRYTASADLGIIPYQATCLNNLYCTPNKLFEYVAAAVPMLASDLPELRRLVVGYDIGLTLDTGSPGTIARALDDLAADDARLDQMRVKVIEARRRLNWAEESKILVDIFCRLKPA